MSEASEVAVRDARNERPTFEYAGQTWTIARKPNMLMLAELALAEQQEDASGFAIIATFFRNVLGDEVYPEFRDAVYTAPEEEQDRFIELIQEIVSKTLGRPTE